MVKKVAELIRKGNLFVTKYVHIGAIKNLKYW